MDWELTNFYIDRPGSLAQVFHFEVLANSAEYNQKQVMFVDGLVFKSGRIRFNREIEIRSKLEDLGISLDSLIKRLSNIIEGSAKPTFAQA